MDVRDELIRLYTTYNPKRLKDVDELLERFRGREHVILASLREMYEQSGPVKGDRDASYSADTTTLDSSTHHLSLLQQNHSSILGASREDGGWRPAGAASARPAVAALHASPSSVAAPSRVPALVPVSSVTAANAHRTTEAAAARHAAAPSFTPTWRRYGSAAGPAKTALLGDDGDGARGPPQRQQWAPSVTATAAGAPADPATASPVLPAPPAATAAAALPLLSPSPQPDDDAAQGSPARQAEMRSLLQHMKALDVSLLAQRVEELSQASQREDERVPRLSWRHGGATALNNNSTSSSGGGGGGDRMGALFAPSAGERATSAASAQDVRAVLQHTAVFLTFFAECAQRYVQLAEAEQQHWEAQQSRPLNARQEEEKGGGSGEASEARAHAAPQGADAEDERGSSAPSSPLRQSASPHRQSPPPPPSSSFPASRVRGVRRASHASPPPRSTHGSPPQCRTSTVSPLTSPDGRTDGGEPTPDRPRRVHSRTASPLRGEEATPQSPPPPPRSPPQTGPLVRAADAPYGSVSAAALHQPSGRVLEWSPAPGEANRYGRLCATLRDGDCVVLQPGVYYENWTFENCGRVEVTSAYPGAAVVLRPAADLDPVISVVGRGSRVKLTGIVLVQGEVGEEGDASEQRRGEGGGGAAAAAPHDASRQSAALQLRLAQPTVPLLSVRDGAGVTATACHFYGGSGGGVVAHGALTHVRLDLCLVSLCQFAAVYLHGGASADVTQSKLKRSEVGLRVLRGSFFMSETAVQENASDGIVLYEESMGVLERSNVFNNNGNGVFLSTGTELRVVASTIELNALYGVQRARGSTLHIQSSFVRDNGLLPINEDQ